jgi:hypothetical protein
MAEGDVVDEAESMIQELLDAGFEYTPNGRVTGFAGVGGDEDGSGDEAGDGDVEDDVPGDSGGEPGEEGAGGDEVDDDARGAHSGRLELKGTPLTDLEADSLLHLRKILIDHPDVSTALNELLTEKLQPRPPTPPPPAVTAEAPVDEPELLPDWIDPDDDTAVKLWNRLQEVESQAKRADETATTTTERITQESHQARVASEIQTAVDRFSADHPALSADDVQRIRNETGAQVNIPGIMANFPGDPIQGLTKALEIGASIASVSDPALADKVLGKTPADPAAEDKKRQRTLDALTGSSGSGPRSTPAAKKPTGWTDVAKQLADEIAKIES